MRSLLLLFLATTTATTPLKMDLSKLVPIDLLPANVTWSGVHHPNVSRDSRIIGGEVAVPHSFPYQVALLVSSSAGTAFCGGSFIDELWILSAAHCFDSQTHEVFVILGAQSIIEVESSWVVVKAEKVYVHPLWDENALANDIALLRLATKVARNDVYISPIRLPSEAQLSMSFASQMATLSGWGKTSYGSDISTVLRYTKGLIMSNSDCGSYFALHDSNICLSGSGNVGGCNGDSGGPLVIEEADGKRTQIGIVSFGYKMCADSYPTAFTRLTTYSAWISSVTGIAVRSDAVVARLSLVLLLLTFVLVLRRH